jgi:hypothetical protein
LLLATQMERAVMAIHAKAPRPKPPRPAPTEALVGGEDPRP